MGILTTLFLVFGVISAAGVYFLFPNWIRDPATPEIKSFEWWGRGKAPLGAEKAGIVSKPFKIQVKQSEIEDLKRRLASTRYSEPLENVNFNYGFPGDQLKKVVDYWLNKYDWSVHQAALNKYSHFKANIEGIDVHYMRVSPAKVGEGTKILPMMIIHGWPGSIVEFIKILPLLTTPNPNRDFVFEVICPSIPGYGFSEAPHKEGFNVAAAARIFNKLMLSLKFDGKYYLQGGDWGSVTAQCMAQLYPDNIRGLHVNLVQTNFKGPRNVLSMILSHVKQSLIMDEGQSKSLYPLMGNLGDLILESGYFHIQATKPDTVGAAISDSPAGLAAYILEKISTGTDIKFRDLPDGGLTKKFTMDELLTNIMIYWINNAITSSCRFYKENLKPQFLALGFVEVPIWVPTGISMFPNEITQISKFMARDTFRNLITMKYHTRGGHFAAMEEPRLLADDIIAFVIETEKWLVEKPKRDNHKES